jgi:chromosome segregation ATPase
MKSSAVRKEESACSPEESGGSVMSEPVESRIARIESHVEHIDAVTTDLRVELRRTNDRIDVTNTKMETGFKELNKKFDDGFKELNKKVDDGYKELRGDYKELNKKFDDGFKELNEKFDDGYKGLNKKVDDGYKELRGDYKELNKKVDDGLQAVNKKIDDVHHSLKDKLFSMTVWALLLYVTLAGGLLTIIARAFKWI